MSVFWLSILVLAVEPPEANPSASVNQPSPIVVQAATASPRKGYELRDAARTALRRWAGVGDDQADQAAVELLGLYKELQQDDRLATSQRQELLTTVRSRLLKLSDQISRRAARQRRQAGQDSPGTIQTPGQGPSHLAQMWGPGPLGAFGGGLGGPGMGGFGMMGQGIGRPGFGGFGGQFGPQGNQMPDYGEALVDLIQKTISPQSWDVNGGPGSIYYWRAHRCLVIRATDEVHGQISDVLDQLERLNR